jgi:hypothetical protein
MSCLMEEDLQREMRQAIHRQTLALDPGAERVRAIGMKKVEQERVDSRYALQLVEARYNSHIASCAACIAGRTFGVSHLGSQGIGL